jgi:hypothetical protein
MSKLCALGSAVFGKTFFYIASASDVESIIRASEDVDKGAGGSRVGR